MTKALQTALAEVQKLPATDQEKIGRQVLHHVEKLRVLRADIDAGIRSLEKGDGEEFDINELLAKAHRRHEGAH